MSLHVPAPRPRQTSADGVGYRDLNNNGVMDPFEDPRRPIAERVDDLTRRLSLAEKAGLMFHTIVSGSDDGELHEDAPDAVNPGTVGLVRDRLITHANIHLVPTPRIFAEWNNRVQALAEQAPHGIPVTISTDPRHAFSENFGASFVAGDFSAWPEPIGLAALRDEDTVREFARIAGAEYRAVGIRSALHPTLDLATEPRWARQYGTFGDDADLVARLAIAYVDGFEGSAVGPDSVACMAKHFPGGGPQKDGEDTHFPYGREHVYPSNGFENHLAPFRALIARGVSAIMPAYGMPVGLTLGGVPVEEVGMAYNRRIITDLLRDELGFSGVICTDWGLVTASNMWGKHLPARAWGVEHLTEDERMTRLIEAGNDQFGGEFDTARLISLVERGLVSIDRIDESVRRLLTVKFELGLFDDPYVDVDAAASLVGTADSVAAGLHAQAASVTVLTNSGVLPLAPGTRVHAPAIAASVLTDAGLVASDADDASVAIVRLDAPFDPRDELMLEAMFHTGSLDFAPETVEAVTSLELPVITVVHLERPAALTPLAAASAALLGVYGTSDAALLDALTGAVPPRGRLPFEIPRSHEAVLNSPSDAPGGSVDPLFESGHGLSY